MRIGGLEPRTVAFETGPVIADLGERMMDILAIGIRLLGASRLLGLPGELTEGAPLAVRTE